MKVITLKAQLINLHLNVQAASEIVTNDQKDGLDKTRQITDNYINKVIHGDALSILKCISEECIDLCVTSPPYWNQRGFQITLII
jgi:hypothetical protein